ncbi:hypothetical protein [Litoreibacter ponti]|nr:hypothetical protein [Litoreibacter ponti]
MALFVNFVWINASEVFRYFAFVMPMMREAFSVVPDVAPMNVPVFLIWGVWDTILVIAATLLPWMAMRVFGASFARAVLYGTGVWFAVFVILWLGLYNMNLATLPVLFTALPLAWLEMVVASVVVWWFAGSNPEMSG